MRSPASIALKYNSRAFAFGIVSKIDLVSAIAQDAPEITLKFSPAQVAEITRLPGTHYPGPRGMVGSRRLCVIRATAFMFPYGTGFWTSHHRRTADSLKHQRGWADGG
jgi:hypothetical protein